MFDFIRISCCVPKVAVANPKKNVEQIIEQIKNAEEKGSNIALFPELAVSGYSCGDLFFQQSLIHETANEIFKIASNTKSSDIIAVVGAPIVILGQIYNCAIIMSKGKICGIVPKTFLANYDEFCEKRWFSGADELTISTINSKELSADIEENYDIPLGNNLIFKTENNVRFGVEICEDMFVPIQPCAELMLSGADIILNLSASNETIGKRIYREDTVKGRSSQLHCAYAYVSCGTDESTTDLIFSGHSIVAENGKITAENKKFLDSDYILTADVDLGKIRADRVRYKSCVEAIKLYKQKDSNLIHLQVNAESDGSLYTVRKYPFIPDEEKSRVERCMNIFDMQIAALKKRLYITGGKAVIGVSGGLDSTLALLVTCAAVKQMDLPMTNICAVTMPCFGTTDRTFDNSVALMKALGVTAKNISIKEACIKHFEDIGHDENIHDVTYENAQARERTQILMDLSNEFGGIVIGTGDLSELALGWCTYCGDQMSMYGVNASIPKTLIRWIIHSLAVNNIFPKASEILKDVLDTPISPELLPPDDSGEIVQKTEDLVGPYELHDFFLYYILRYGYSPSKIYHLAKMAYSDVYSNETIKKWLRQFYKRFFTQQFKRSCMPDGVKIGKIGLSPKGDLKMPSDAESELWLSEIDRLD